MKELSCGVIILNEKNEILLCHVTGQKHWDIPKGLNENEELPISTVIRETKEETNIDLIKGKLIDMGGFPYNKKKNLYLFKYFDNNIDLNSLKCVSTFEHFYTKELMPEVDEFSFFDFQTAKTKVCGSMKNVFDKLKV
jgi:putative (di)nucleoside polyphosphate hydrolase